MDMTKDAKFWLSELRQADKHEEKWRTRARKVLKIYKADTSDKETQFNILWSNTQTQKPALFSATPKPVVKRRHRQEKPLSREMAVLLERCLEYSLDPGSEYDFQKVGEKLIMDYLLPGRMVARVKYHPIMIDGVKIQEFDEVPEDGSEFEVSDDGRFLYEAPYEELVGEEVRVSHVPYDQYRQSVADHWEDVWWIAYGNNFLTKEEIVEQFGEKHEDVPLKYRVHSEEKDGNEEKDDDREIKRAQVWEIWDREERKVYAVVQGYDKLLMEIDDPLGLRSFFPQPEPVNIVECPNTLVPIPEYTLYQFQANELNQITRRIEHLVKGMKLVGIYPGSHKKTMEDMFEKEENTLIPVEDWAAITERGGLNGMIEWVPLREVADAWQRLMQYRVTLVQSIYELTGISDIQRGATDPRETKGAQQLKANFATRRMLPKRQDTQRFFRDLFRLKVEIMVEHFEPETLISMANIPEENAGAYIRAIEQMRESEDLRHYAIDIETDSTIAADEEMDKQGVAEFTAAMSAFLGQIFPIVQAQPAAVGPLGKMMLWMSRKFRIARDAEDELEEFLQTFQQLPDNTKAAEQAANQQAQQEMQMKMQEADMKLQIEQARLESMQLQMQLKQQESQAEISRKQQEHDAELQQERETHALKIEQLQLDIMEMRAKIQLMREEAEAKIVLAASESSRTEQPAQPVQQEQPSPKGKRLTVIKDKDGKAKGIEVKPAPEVTRLSFNRDDEGQISTADLE